MTSDEAAALFISNGQTSNLSVAQMIDGAQSFDMDALQRASIRRTLGFDFDIKIDYNTPFVLVHSTQRPFCHTKAKMYEGDVTQNALLANEAAVSRVIRAIERLKIKYDKLVELEADVIDVEED